MHLPPCLLRLFFGVSCPGCGMTRAFLRLFRLDFSGAFRAHPLFWTVPIILGVALFHHKLPKKFVKIFEWGMISLFLAVYLCRMFDPADTVVYFRPESGVLFSHLKNLLWSRYFSGVPIPFPFLPPRTSDSIPFSPNPTSDFIPFSRNLTPDSIPFFPHPNLRFYSLFSKLNLRFYSFLLISNIKKSKMRTGELALCWNGKFISRF